MDFENEFYGLGKLSDVKQPDRLVLGQEDVKVEKPTYGIGAGVGSANQNLVMGKFPSKVVTSEPEYPTQLGKPPKPV